MTTVVESLLGRVGGKPTRACFSSTPFLIRLCSCSAFVLYARFQVWYWCCDDGQHINVGGDDVDGSVELVSVVLFSEAVPGSGLPGEPAPSSPGGLPSPGWRGGLRPAVTVSSLCGVGDGGGGQGMCTS